MSCGLPFAHLRVFDRFERNPEKGHPLRLKRVKLPKRPMGLYESTVMDTTDRKIPWYYPAAFILLAAVVAGGDAMSDVKAKLGGESPTVIATPKPKAKEGGAGATADAAAGAPGALYAIAITSHGSRRASAGNRGPRPRTTGSTSRWCRR